MAQNLIALTADNPNIHENNFYMLWNAILGHHFPITLGYGVALQTSVTGTGTKPEFLIVKLVREEESVVVVVELKKPADDTVAGRSNVKGELVDYIEERFDETQFDTIYGIYGIGLSWAAYKIHRGGPPEPELVMDWRGDVTSATSYDSMRIIAEMVDTMTGTTRQ